MWRSSSKTKSSNALVECLLVFYIAVLFVPSLNQILLEQAYVNSLWKLLRIILLYDFHREVSCHYFTDIKVHSSNKWISFFQPRAKSCGEVCALFMYTSCSDNNLYLLHYGAPLLAGRQVLLSLLSISFNSLFYCSATAEGFEPLLFSCRGSVLVLVH